VSRSNLGTLPRLQNALMPFFMGNTTDRRHWPRLSRSDDFSILESSTARNLDREFHESFKEGKACVASRVCMRMREGLIRSLQGLRADQGMVLPSAPEFEKRT